eukprot:TRINITY_DN101550_c0_g1_i1.p1 TRINITY_DN101550_c0_g1~~TRINITY_DN101550_c0_g1_i1.p1  ORF type:complete len:215 (-),score=64.12 TRINITY_DN101550_c0_g1_i1:224-868(-)
MAAGNGAGEPPAKKARADEPQQDAAKKEGPKQNFGPTLHGDIDRILFCEDTLRKRCREMGEQISKDYEGKDPLLVGVITGAISFMADLMRYITIHVELDFIQVSSYGKGAVSGELKFKKDVSTDVKGRHVIFVEDIVDTGRTLKLVGGLFADRGCASTAICSLLDKKAHRVEGVKIDYAGFDCPDEFIVGYGIDFAERYRNLPYVGALKRSVYQ